MAHIKAGARSFNEPILEKANRVRHVSSYLFCPSITGASNIKSAGLTKNVYLEEAEDDKISTSTIKYRCSLLFQKIYMMMGWHRKRLLNSYSNY